MSRQTKSLFLLLFLLMTSAATANNTRPDSAKYRFSPVVVTATKVAGAQRDIAASVSVIDKKMIEQSNVETVLEAVNAFVPGIHITERAVYGYGVAAGAAGGISIRGVGGAPVTGVLVLRDGRPDIMGQMGHPIPDAYSLAGVEKIEIVRGPASFLYGTNAMGGVINIVSAKNKGGGFSTKIGGGVASYNSGRLSLAHGGRIGKLEYNITAGSRKSDGHRDYSGYDGDFYTAHLGYEVGPATNLSLNANLANVYLSDPGPVDAPKADHWYDLRRSGIDLTLDHTSTLGESYVRVHGNFGRHRIFDGWQSKDRTLGLMLYHNFSPLSGNISTFGFDIKQYGGDALESKNKIPVIDYSRHFIVEYAPYIHTQQIFRKNFLASAGLRLEQHQIYGTQLLPKAGLVFHTLPVTSIRLSVARGFRSPSIRELYIFPPRNRELLPEEMWNYEVGLTQNLGQSVRIDAALFKSRGKNMIRLTGLPPQFTNSGRFTHTGYEIVFDWKPVERLFLSATWSKLDLANETLYTPGKKLTGHIAYDLQKIQLSLLLMNVRDLYGTDYRLKKMQNYTLVNLFATVKPLPSIGLQVGVKNLFDVTYQTMYNYPMPGRIFSADINYFL